MYFIVSDFVNIKSLTLDWKWTVDHKGILNRKGHWKNKGKTKCQEKHQTLVHPRNKVHKNGFSKMEEDTNQRSPLRISRSTKLDKQSDSKNKI